MTSRRLPNGRGIERAAAKLAALAPPPKTSRMILADRDYRMALIAGTLPPGAVSVSIIKAELAARSAAKGQVHSTAPATSAAAASQKAKQSAPKKKSLAHRVADLPEAAKTALRERLKAFSAAAAVKVKPAAKPATAASISKAPPRARIWGRRPNLIPFKKAAVGLVALVVLLPW